MFGYIFEVSNKKTGETYLGKRYAVSFDKKYFGEENNPKLAVDIEKYGRPFFEVRMIMPYESPDILDAAFESMAVPAKKVKAVKEEVEEPKEKPVRKKKSTKAEG